MPIIPREETFLLLEIEASDCFPDNLLLLVLHYHEELKLHKMLSIMQSKILNCFELVV